MSAANTPSSLQSTASVGALLLIACTVGSVFFVFLRNSIIVEAMIANVPQAHIAIATASARKQCVPTSETLIRSMLALFVNEHAFEQHRLLLLTDQAVHRVKFDFASMRVVHANAMPLSAIVEITKGYLRRSDGRSRFGFQMTLRLDDKTVKSYVFLSLADEIMSSAHRRPRSTTALADQFVMMSAAAVPSTVGGAELVHSTRTLEDVDVCERQVEKFTRAIASLAPTANVVHEALRLAAAEEAVQKSSIVARLYNKLQFGRQRSSTEGALLVQKPLAPQVRAIVSESAGADEQWLHHQLAFVESQFSAPCGFVRASGIQRGVFYLTRREVMFCIEADGANKASRSVWQLVDVEQVTVRMLATNTQLVNKPGDAGELLALVISVREADDVWLLFEFEQLPLAQEAIEMARERPAAPSPALPRRKEPHTPSSSASSSSSTLAVPSFDSPESGPLSLPSLPIGDDLLLDSARQRRLAKHLPSPLRVSQWQLFYKLTHDGASLTTLLASQPGGPQLLVVEDSRKRRFGAFLCEPWPRTPANRFFGNGSCFLFDSAMRAFTWSRQNQFFMFSCDEYFAVGSGRNGRYGLMIDQSLETGSTSRTETFCNPPLCSSGTASSGDDDNDEVNFDIYDIEIWGFE